MTHEIAKLLLEQAGNFLDRTTAIEKALSLGMPLSQIEDYLDWVDVTKPHLSAASEPPGNGQGVESVEPLSVPIPHLPHPASGDLPAQPPHQGPAT